MDKIENNEYKTFEDIKHVDENDIEYWYAREIQLVLQYVKWQKFLNVIERAKEACKNTDYFIDDHFHQVVNMVQIGSGAQRK
ncbi:MAG: hypothetical protein RSE41_02860 [Clostridia bacterium]